jgi:hypothetical protein
MSNKNKNKRKVVTIPILIFSMGILFYQYRTASKKISKLKTKKIVKTKLKKKKQQTKLTSTIPKKETSIVKKDKNSLSIEEKESLKTLIHQLALAMKAPNAQDDLIQNLKDLNLNPTRNIDNNKYTGDLTIIRTENTLPGTRYFHAQYFSSKSNSTPQHLSFELRKSKNSFPLAIDMIKNEFNISGKAKYKNKNFISWDHSDHYSVWIKVLETSDLKDDPFNAYTKDDIGTVRIVIEEEIH